jgi:hypothetical protein
LSAGCTFSQVRERFVKYMAWAGFLEPATHALMGGDWPEVCRSCAQAQGFSIALAAWALAAALVELWFLAQRRAAARDTSGAKAAACVGGSLSGLLATAWAVSLFAHGCVAAVRSVGGVGPGVALGPGAWCGVASAAFRGVGLGLQLALRAGAPTPPPEFQPLPPRRRGGSGSDPRGVYERVQSGAGRAFRRAQAMGAKAAGQSASGSAGHPPAGGGSAGQEEELRYDQGEAHNHQAFVDYYGCVAALGGGVWVSFCRLFSSSSPVSFVCLF